MFKLHYFIVLAGVWALGNGILHDVFILLQRKPFDRELIRLLIDGLILIFSGIFYILCYQGVKEHQFLAFLICILTAIFRAIIYSALIY